MRSWRASEAGSLGRLYAWCVVTMRWLIVLGWGAAAAAVLWLPSTAQQADLGGFAPPNSKAIATERASAEAFGFPLLSRTVLVQRNEAGLSAGAQERAVERAVGVAKGTHRGRRTDRGRGAGRQRQGRLHLLGAGHHGADLHLHRARHQLRRGGRRRPRVRPAARQPARRPPRRGHRDRPRAGGTVRHPLRPPTAARVPDPGRRHRDRGAEVPLLRRPPRGAADRRPVVLPGRAGDRTTWAG